MEMVSSGELDHIHISFMIAGHTKFAPDRLFSTIGCAYKTEDVFIIGDLKSIRDKGATCHIETGLKGVKAGVQSKVVSRIASLRRL